MNSDAVIDFLDINAFVLYLSNFPVWQTTYAGCDAACGDIDGNGAYPSFGDINPFVTLFLTHALPLPYDGRQRLEWQVVRIGGERKPPERGESML
ncbi:MAG: hypothetical protein KA383_04805 [Phycisphaerae bacterium]|nr:hypothetical protein [Phycisphaerae bacterium]